MPRLYLPRAQLLIVEDEQLVGLAVQKALGQAGYAVDTAGSGAEALELLRRTPYDGIVLDLVLPDMQGMELLRHALRLQPDLLVFILTGHSSLESAVAAVNYGAVGYLLKSGDIRETVRQVIRALQAHGPRLREHSALRVIKEILNDLYQDGVAATPAPNPEPQPARTLEVPPLRLNRSRQVVSIDGDPPRTCDLTPAETALLAKLMESPNHVLSDHELGVVLSGHLVPGRQVQNAVRHHILRLRRKIEAVPERPQLIQTVRGAGYIFVPSEGAPADRQTSL